MAMTEQRRQEIALMIVEQKAFEMGISSDNLKRDMGNLGQKIGVSTEELTQFYESMVPRIYGRIFGYTEVSIKASGKK